MTGFVDVTDVFDGLHDGKRVSLRGWLYNRRSSGGIQFLEVRDGTGVIQCTLNRSSVDEGAYGVVEGLPLESTLELEGVVNVDDRAPGGREVSVESVGGVSAALPDYPITKKRHGVEFLMDNRHLYVRNPKVQTMMRIRAGFLKAARGWFEEHGWT